MAKKNKEETLNTCGIKCKNGKYYCADCGTEITVDHDCPTCRRHVDWERAMPELRRLTT